MKQTLAAIAFSAFTVASTAAQASPATDACEAMQQAKSPELRRAFATFIWSDAWKDAFENGCSVEADNEGGDRWDSPQLVYVADVIRSFGGVSGAETAQGYGGGGSTFVNGSRAAYAISRLDRKQFDKEIKPFSAFHQKLLIGAWDFAQGEIKAYDTWRASQAKTPGGRRMWQDGYAKVVQAALADFAAHGDDIAFGVSALEAAEAGKPCPDVLGRFHAYLKRAAPKTAEDAKIAVQRSAAAELLWDAVGQCALASDNDQVAMLVTEAGGAFNFGEYIDGPSARVADALHELYEVVTIKAHGIAEPARGNGHVAKLSLSAPMTIGDIHHVKADINGSLTRFSFYGAIASTKAKGKFVEVSFKKKIESHWLSLCSTSNRIKSIDENGNVEYDADCEMSRGKPHNVAPFPVKVPAEFAKNLKVGQMLFFAEISDSYNGSPKANRIALPVEVYKSDKEKAPLAGLLGAGW